MNKKAIINFEPIQDGDVIETDADIDFSKTKLGYNPKLSIEEGIYNFIEWFKGYHGH